MNNHPASHGLHHDQYHIWDRRRLPESNDARNEARPRNGTQLYDYIRLIWGCRHSRRCSAGVTKPRGTSQEDLDQATNTFVVIYPSDHTRDWFISVATRRGALGGYEIERHDRDTDPDQAHPTKTAAAVPADIATDVLDWISQR